MSATEYPFAQELITDIEGKIRKIVLDYADYQRLLEMLEDEALYQAMQETHDEVPMSREEALAMLDTESGLKGIDEYEPTESLLSDLQESLEQARSGQTFPIEELWTDLESY